MTARGELGRPVTLRSTSWDGPAPGAGDYLTTRAGSWYLVTDVAEGAGVGHYRLGCVTTTAPAALPDGTRVYRWTWARR